jgi:hypothetical protein
MTKLLSANLPQTIPGPFYLQHKKKLPPWTMKSDRRKRNWYLLDFAEMIRTRRIDANNFIVHFFSRAVKNDSSSKPNFFAVLRQIKNLGGATDTQL